ncbi:MAG: Sua5/YciO/YrdC/YwlC family protein [Cyanobium sp.]|jgi:L-threonylcarbamoyladenylate synthase
MACDEPADPVSHPVGAAAAVGPGSLPAVSMLLDQVALAQHLREGGAALFPTDTVPALAASPAQAQSLWRLKLRPMDKPLILMGADLEQLQQLLAIPWRRPWLEMAERSWPGAVTLVLPIEGPITQWLHPGGHSLGLRVPACAAAQALLRLSGPLATTSINRSGQPAALDALAAACAFPDLPLLAPIPWPACRGQPSRVLGWCAASGTTAEAWRELRPGPEGVGQPAPPPD